MISSLGFHIITELSKCANIKFYDNEENLKTLLEEVIKEANLNAVKIVIHKFENQGITGLIALQESHLSAHLFPEFSYVSLDAFTCGEDESKADKAIKYFAKALKVGFSHTRIFQRGIPLNQENTLFYSQELFVKND